MPVLIGSGIKVEVQKTLDAPKTITSITKANPAVVTITSHGYANGDVVVLNVEGMQELNKVAARIANVSTNTFELEGIDSTNFGTFTSGTAARISAWDPVAWARSVNLPNGSATEIELTTLGDITRQYTYGMPDAARGSIEGLFDPTHIATANLRAATRANAERAFRLTWKNGVKAIFNSNVSAGDGFSQGLNEAATTSVDITVRGFVNFYAN